MKTLLVLLIATLANQASAESLGKKWFCQEDYVCKEAARGGGQLVYPSKLSSGLEESIARDRLKSAKLPSVFKCLPGTLKLEKKAYCKFGNIDTK